MARTRRQSKSCASVEMKPGSGVTKKKKPGSKKVKSKVAKEKVKTQIQLDEEERKMRKKIMEKLTKIKEYEDLVAKLTTEVTELEQKFVESFGKPFEETDEEFDYTTITATYNKRDEHQNEKGKFPVRGKCCEICGSRSKQKFSKDDTIKLCFTCLASAERNNIQPGEEITIRNKTYKYRQIKCVCPKQLAGQHQPDWRVSDCMRDKLAMIKTLHPTLYTSDNLVAAERPVFTQPGNFGYLMDLKTVKRENYTNTPPDGVNTAALLVTVMDLNQINDREVNGVQVKGQRVLGVTLLKVEFDDPRLDSALGIQRLVTRNSKPRNAIGKVVTSSTVDSDLVHVDLEMINWTPADPTNATVVINCSKAVHFLLNPKLNLNQSFSTRLGIMEVQSKHLTLDGLNSFLKKRKVSSVGWKRNKTPRLDLVGPQFDSHGGNNRSTVTASTSSDSEYMANVYAYFVKKGQVVWIYAGSHFGVHSRQLHTHANTSLTTFLMDNPEAEWFSTTLVYLKKNDNDTKRLFEGQVQFNFKLAELNKKTLNQLTLPFPNSGVNNNWTNLDKTKLPKLEIQLLNDTIHCRHMDSDSFQFFLNLPRVLFDREFEYPNLYRWEKDPLRFTIDPSNAQPMEVHVEQEVEGEISDEN